MLPIHYGIQLCPWGVLDIVELGVLAEERPACHDTAASSGHAWELTPSLGPTAPCCASGLDEIPMVSLSSTNKGRDFLSLVEVTSSIELKFCLWLLPSCSDGDCLLNDREMIKSTMKTTRTKPWQQGTPVFDKIMYS